jgi:hypothetical protein
MSSRTSCVVAAPIAAVAPSKDKSKRLARKIFDRLVDQKKKTLRELIVSATLRATSCWMTDCTSARTRVESAGRTAG